MILMVSISWRNILMLIFHQFYFFFSFSICLSATVLDSVVSNPLPVFKFKLQLLSFRVPIKKFPYHSRRELTIMPEECWLLLEHSLIFFFCFLFFSFFFLFFYFFFTQTPVRPNIHQQENRPQLHAWTLLNYVTHTLLETTRYMTVWPKKINNKSAEKQQF